MDIERDDNPQAAAGTDPEAPAGNPRHRTPWDTVDGRVISLVSRKGGVGKTTSAVNLGAALALSGHTVLVVGVDPQCGVCRSLGTEQDELDTGLAELRSGRKPLNELVQTSPLRDLFFVSPRIESLEDEESYLEWLTTRPDDFVDEIDRARTLYDTILIDCPPNLGSATRAALMASDSFLVPVQAEELCRGTIEPLLEFVDTFRSRSFAVRTDRGPAAGAPDADRPLRLEGLFLTMVNERTRMGRHVSSRLGEDFGEEVLEASVPRTTRLSEMALRGKPAVIYDRRSPGSRAYFDLADELVYRFRRDCEAAEAAAADAAADPGAPVPASGGGLDRFLAELGGAREVSSRIPAFEEPSSPEMVSLDDLLAEEEDQSGEQDDWGDDPWSDSRVH